ncbi:phytoene/squalene synthase family protein [Gephyromycinifex aptenodytis]|uniref:phytoene/squalene synthase family protein n=1 Tax=Gephyromycinifex aptenodytis TaxID=2716227 RepID=UPI001445A44E|nr:phytoene/squalene synthase family protein [Gephyromycinifex aptenodytis]
MAGLPSPEPSSPPRELLAAGYRQAREITWKYGTTYFWGTALLSPQQRCHVYAVYALCRLADDIVDAPGATVGDTSATRAGLTQFAAQVDRAVEGGPTQDALLAAIGHTIRHTNIEKECLTRFFDAMALDLSQHTYRTWEDLLAYMEGSAAVVGEMMLPVLRPMAPGAREPARALGFAFQLTNFLRDVGEDLERGRVYIPQEDLERFDADPARREVTAQWRELMAFEIARNRRLYAQADTGIPLLPTRSAQCVATARALYSQILDRIEASDYDVFSQRVRVPTWRKALTAASA